MIKKKANFLEEARRKLKKTSTKLTEDKPVIKVAPTPREKREEGLMDPILLCEIPESEPTYTYKRPNGTQIVFCISTLVEYMQLSRKFVDPGSQIAFTDKDLLEIEDAAEAAGFPRPCLVIMKNDKEVLTEDKNKLDVTYGIDRMIENLVAEMLEIITSQEPRSEVERQLWQIFDQIGQYYQQLCLDLGNMEFAVQCRNSYIRFIKGPTSNPTPDREGLLTMCLEFFDRLALFTDVAFN